MDLEQILKRTRVDDPESLQELAVWLFRRGYGPSKIPGYYMVRVLDSVTEMERTFLISTEEIDEEGLRDLRAIDSDLLNRLFDNGDRENSTPERILSLMPYIRVMARLFPKEFQEEFLENAPRVFDVPDHPLEWGGPALPHLGDPGDMPEEAMERVLQIRGLWSKKPNKYDVEFPRILLESFILPR